MPDIGKRGVVRFMAMEPRRAKLTISQIEMYLFTKPPSGADAEAIANDQNPNHQTRIDRGPYRTVEID